MQNRCLRALLGSSLLLAAITGSVISTSAAPRPNPHAKPEVTDLATLEGFYAQLFSDVCAVPVTVDIAGWVISHTLVTPGAGRRQPQAIDIWHITSETVHGPGGSFTTDHDLGPDIYFLVDGELKVAITGRSLTGSGVIGRVIYDVETGELEFEAGKRLYDDFMATVCTAIT